MLSRSNTKPIVVALGTATILTLSTAAAPVEAFAADPSPTAGGTTPDPTPSDSPSDTPSDPPPSTSPPSSPPPSSSPPASPPPQSSPGAPGSSHGPSYHPVPSLAVRLSLSATTAAPGGSVLATAHVSASRTTAHHTVVRFSAPSTSAGGAVSLGDVRSERTASRVVAIPAGHAPGSIKVTATVSADKAGARGASATITVSVAGAGPSGAAPAGGGTVLSPPGQVPGMAGLPTSATAVEGPPQAQLPLIAPQPAIAPDVLPDAQPVSLRTSTTVLGLDPESYRLLLIQVAWLTALLVGISLMLTQLRLNRRRLAARGAVRGAGSLPRR